jgi:hypothetical protein
MSSSRESSSFQSWSLDLVRGEEYGLIASKRAWVVVNHLVCATCVESDEEHISITSEVTAKVGRQVPNLSIKLVGVREGMGQPQGPLTGTSKSST